MTNNCPKCKIGIIYCKDIDNKWIEHCTNCDYQKEHINRRKKDKPINFNDRRRESGC
jgi:hypothetical protein